MTKALPIRFVPLPRQWPGRQRPQGWKPTPSRFKGHAWGKVERELLAELERLRAKDITIALDLHGPGNIREDGGLRADARPVTSRVVLSFVRGDAGMRLTFPCDSFSSWEDNLWAIRLTLEHLRAIDRYGVTQGDQQYVGFTALASGKPASMSLDDALLVLATHGEADSVDLLTAPDWLVDAVQKRARAATHPDTGGREEQFKDVEEAIRLVAAARTTPERG